MPARRHLVQNQAEGEQICAGIQLFFPNLFRRHITGGANRGSCAGQSSSESFENRFARLGWNHACVCRRIVRRFSNVLPYLFRSGKFGEAKIQDLRSSLHRKENVRRLNVAMDDALVMRGLQTMTNLNGNIQESSQTNSL